MQTLAFPLVVEFGWTKEIEDRLLAPMPTELRRGARRCCSPCCARSTATLVMIPIGILVLGSIPWRWAGLPLFLAGLVLGALVGAGFGLVMGTLVQPERINLLFSLVFTPLLFTGCSQYPWPSLDHIRWFQIVTACNPMTYVSEALRGALVPTGAAHRAVDLHRRARSSPSACCSRSGCGASTAARSTEHEKRAAAPPSSANSVVAQPTVSLR